MPEPTLDVVVAVSRRIAGLEECLASLQQQREAFCKAIVVSNCQPPQALRDRFPWVIWRAAPPRSLIPQMWAQGIHEARAEIIALSTAQFVPASDWASAIRRAHGRLAAVGIGGVIDPPRGRGVVVWAEYFVRYYALLVLDREQPVADFAADNASYKRLAILARTRDGFWEHEIHRGLQTQPGALVWTPQIRVSHHASLGFWSFLQQRFVHGWWFGSVRGERNGAFWRCLAVLACPLIPVVLLTKIVRNVLASGRDFLPFCVALPVLMCFLLAWSLGETWGYACPNRRTEARSLLATGREA